MFGDIEYTTSINEYDIDKICTYITEKANRVEYKNKMGFCDHEKIGFVHGLRWCVQYLKSFKGVIK